jgi:hypothetical protein
MEFLFYCALRSGLRLPGFLTGFSISAGCRTAGDEGCCRASSSAHAVIDLARGWVHEELESLLPFEDP